MTLPIQNSSKTSNLLQQQEPKVELISRPEGVKILDCKPIKAQIAEHGQEPVQFIIQSALTKVSLSMFGAVDAAKRQQIDILSEDLISKYEFDSVEDICEALRKGRINKNGNYPNPYNRFNMGIIEAWIGQHLAEKAEIREKHLKESYRTPDKPLIEYKQSGEEKSREVDYKAYKRRTYKHRSRGSQRLKEQLKSLQMYKAMVRHHELIKRTLGHGLNVNDDSASDKVEGLLFGYGLNVLKISASKCEQLINQIKNK